MDKLTIGDLVTALKRLDQDAPLSVIDIETCGTVTGSVEGFYADAGAVELIAS